MSKPVALLRGVSCEVVTDAVNPATTVYSKNFCVPPIGSVQSVQFSQKGASALDGNLQSSHDGGTTWVTFTAFDLLANPALVMELIAGILYRFSFTTCTTATSVDVFACLR